MRGRCWFCQKSVTSELPDEAVLRAILICPECIEAKRVTFPDDESAIVIADDVPPTED